jgi:hypothetical protein
LWNFNVYFITLTSKTFQKSLYHMRNDEYKMKNTLPKCHYTNFLAPVKLLLYLRACYTVVGGGKYWTLIYRWSTTNAFAVWCFRYASHLPWKQPVREGVTISIYTGGNEGPEKSSSSLGVMQLLKGRVKLIKALFIHLIRCHLVTLNILSFYEGVVHIIPLQIHINEWVCALDMKMQNRKTVE